MSETSEQTEQKVERGLRTPVHVTTTAGTALGLLAVLLLVTVTVGYTLGEGNTGTLTVVAPMAELGPQRTWNAVLALVGTSLVALAVVWDRHAAWAKVKTLAVVGLTLAGAGIAGGLVPLAL